MGWPDSPDSFTDHTDSRAHRPAESLPLTGPRTSIKDVHAKAGTRRRSAVIGAMGARGCFARLSRSVIGSLQAALLRRLTGARNVSLAWRFEGGSGVYRGCLCVRGRMGRGKGGMGQEVDH